MNCFITEMREKEVINLANGCRLGCVNDVEIDTCSGCLVSIVIYGKSKFFGLLGRCEDIKIPWKDITVIGDDTILVNCEFDDNHNRSSNSFLDILFKNR